jgi:hypothetical protein
MQIFDEHGHDSDWNSILVLAIIEFSTHNVFENGSIIN